MSSGPGPSRKQGPELLDHRLAAYGGEQRMIFGATTFGLFLQMLPAVGDERDPWMDRMVSCPATAQTGDEPVFAGAGDFDLDLLETRTFGRPHPGAGLPAHPPHLAGQLDSATRYGSGCAGREA